MFRPLPVWQHRLAPRRAVLFLALLALMLGSLPSAHPIQAASSAVLLKDVIPGTMQSYPSQPVPKPLATVGTTHFFVNYDFNNGYDLWRTDGTAAGTALVRDVFPGRSEGFFSDPVAVGGLLFFTALPWDGSESLWRSDGTAAGTFALKALGPNPLSSVSSLTAVGSTLFFQAHDGQGRGLWKSDGTEAGTQKVKALAGSIDDTYGLAGAGDRLFFVSTDGIHGRELWQSDGTEAGTQMVADLNPGGDAFSPSFSQENPPSQIAAIGSAVVFRATDGTKTGLWRGQGAGLPIEYLSPLAFAKGTLVGAELYFSTTGGGVGKTDGTPAGTLLLKSGVTPGSLVGFGGQVFFVDQPYGSFDEGELWKTDGTPAGTQKLIGYPVEFSAVAAGSTKLFLFARRSGQREVWVSDGTPETTAQLKEINPTEDDAANYLAVLGGKVLFGANDGNGPALWGSDGTAEGTALVNNATLLGDNVLDWYRRGAATITTVGNKLFFSVSGTLWCSDGTSAGTRVVKVFGTSDADRIYGAAEGNGLLFFSVIESGTVSLWRSNGTPEGTVQLKQFSELDFGPRVLAVGGQVYVVTGTQAAYQFWRTDGTPEGMLPLFSLQRGPNPPPGDFPRELTAVGDKLFFTYSDVTYGTELWVSDGTQAGTRLVKDLSVGEYGAGPYDLADLNGTLVFMVSTHSDGTYPAKGFSLWKSDGSATGTTLLAQFDYNINVPVELKPSQITLVGTKAFFTAWDKDTGNELWFSDGTPAGTRQVTDINTVPIPYYDSIPGASKNRSSAPHSLTVLGDTLLFAANDDIHGDELWKSDGTAAGTVLVKDLYPGTIGARISEIRALPGTGRVAFAGSDGLSGIELWSSDGSAGGTIQLADLARGASSSNPAVLLPTQQQLFFLADDGLVGSEPWALDLDALPNGRTQIFLPLLRK